LARYLQGVHHYHNWNVQPRSFNVGDMVLWWIHDDTGLHILNSWWEGPFIVHKVTGSGSYCLQYPDGQEVPNSWNIEHLRRFHPWSTGDIFYWCPEIDTSSTMPFYWFTIGTTSKSTEGASLPYFPVRYYLFSTCTLCYWRGLDPMTRSLLVCDWF
jgi:hypothetical protein